MAAADIQEELTREEAKRILRRLELDAYSAVVTAFRAQGDVNSISTERHRAEVRRVVNDERLNAVAECMQGCGTSTEWMYEGRRLISLMPRLVPQTVYTAKATIAANQAVEANLKLPLKTEIELLPMPTKPKGPAPKGIQPTDQRDFLISPATDHSKKKKKPNVLNLKPPPLILNKSIATAMKSSTQNTSASMKSVIKNKLIKASSFPLSDNIASTSVSPVKYSPTQQSPTNPQASSSQSPISGVLPLTLLSTNFNSETSTHSQLNNLPTKVISSSESLSNHNVSLPSTSTYFGNSFTQKIKFKTPLPKSKLKHAKFKPMTTLQRVVPPISQINDSNILASSNQILIPPNPGMSVKVVQLAKTNCTPLLSTVNRAVVSVNKNPIQSAVAFNNIATSISQQMKAASATQLPSSVMSALPKGALPSKSMPLTTGFKMIAVTTVVQGTTQVKTVYIATPIMSLSKSVSPPTCASVTTAAATQSLKRTPSSIASNIQSVVARSMNAAAINYLGKPAQISSITSVAPPTSTIGKTSQVSPRGLGSLKTTLSGHAQSLKLFTAVSKSNRAQFSNVNLTKNASLLPGANLVSSQYSLGNIQLKCSEVKIDKLTTPTNQLENTTIDSMKIINKFCSSDDSVNKLCSTDAVVIATEQITASATADTDDMAFLNAGERFLEQLSAKMTATSPDISKNNFLFTNSIDHFESNPLKENLCCGDENFSGLISKLSNLNENNSTCASVFNAAVDSFSQCNNTFSGSFYEPVITHKTTDAESCKVLFSHNISKPIDSYILKTSSDGVTSDCISNSYINGFYSVNDLHQSNALHISMLNPQIRISSVFTNSSQSSILIPKNSLSLPKTNSPEIYSTQTVPLSNSFDIGSTPTNLSCSTNISTAVTHLAHIVPNMPIMAATKILSCNKVPAETKKRKVPVIQESSDFSSPVPARTQASWIRGAANLLQRVSRFRGPTKQKGEMNAASWFTRPVDPNEAPGYYRVIKTPMDFGKIKRKLENGEYSNYTMFYDDMMLIKSNCYAYNPVEHAARKDCDDVFSFFEAEFKKLLERWEKYHVSPHKKMKISTEFGENG